MSRRTHHKHDTAPLSLYNWHTITLCLVSDHKTVVRKFGKSDGQTGSRGLDKAFLPAQSSVKLHQFLCSKGYAVDNLDEQQGIYLSQKLHPHLQSNSSVHASVKDVVLCSANTACM